MNEPTTTRSQMDKMVRLSDAISAILEEKISGQQLEIVRAIGSGVQAETLNQACDRHAQLIRDLPAVDAVEVVRCRECRWHEDEQPGMVYCPATVGGWVENDWFCKGGERGEEEHNALDRR